MIIPTPQAVRTWSKVDFTSLGFATDDRGPEGLLTLVDRAVASFQRTTGLQLTAVQPAIPLPSGEPYLLLPEGDPMEPLAQRAIQAMVEQQAFDAQPDTLDDLSDWTLIQSFSASSYSETRRTPQEMFQGRMLNPWPQVSLMLWELLTPGMYSWWLTFFTGQHMPAWDTQELVWNHDAIGFADIYPYGLSP